MGGVLLAINCQEDKLYAYRHLIAEMYAGRFDELAFVVNETCEPDPAFANVVATWKPPPYCPARECPCNDPYYGRHADGVHSKHPRLAELAAHSGGFDAVLFADTDCVLSPSLDSSAVLGMLEGVDVVMPPIEYRPREDWSWCWTHRESGYPSLDRLARYLDRGRLIDHWRALGGAPIDPEPPPPLPPMFAAFSDWLAFRSDFLREVAPDFIAAQEVWHEVAVPTIILHATPRIRFSHCLVLWEGDRDRPLPWLVDELRRHDFVHPIKFGRHGAELLEAYRGLRPG